MINVIHATILEGKFTDEEVLIPRIPMIPTDMPFEFKQNKFLIRVTFAMMNNKSQGQLFVSGLKLQIHVFLMANYMWHVQVLVNHPLYLSLCLITKQQKTFIRRCLTLENKPKCLYRYKK